jgi:hypothetical protein
MALWLVQPADNLIAALTAGALLLAGMVAYMVRAAPPVPPVEAARVG